MIWVIGAAGMLGSDILQQIKNYNLPVCATDQECDITNTQTVENFLQSQKISCMINCAAFTDVNGAEQQKEKAFAVNARGPEVLASAAQQYRIPLIHFSTDYVFSGNKTSPYLETDNTGPLSVYGESKLAGEKAVQENCSNYYIIRISWLYGVNGKNFVKTMLRLLAEKPEINIVNDQYGSPTSSLYLGRNIAGLIKNFSGQWGIYHYADEGIITWYDFTCAIQELGKKYGILSQTAALKPVSTGEYPTPAVRPAYSGFCKNKIIKVLGFTVKPWRENLEEIIRLLAG
ncbi:MAG: dTDP-4-dehydrorhamnose reductase [Spirochaetes bacterium GWF1_41_5]|nr:MAG: dTDP-4-dehydrorhamnose reductase [Spirochaetes bacterium GWF1_41_5]